MVPRFAHAVLRSGSSGSGLTWLRPHMALAIDHVRVMQRPVVRLDFPGCICSPMEKRVPTVCLAMQSMRAQMIHLFLDCQENFSLSLSLSLSLSKHQSINLSI